MKTLLCIDDQRDSLHVRRLLLEAHGYAVLTADNGEQGMNYFFRHRPDLVVLDYRMPGLTGLDVARNMRRLRPEIPIILLTGFSDELPQEMNELVNVIVEKGEPATALLEHIERLTGEAAGEFRMPDAPERVLLASQAQVARARDSVQRAKEHVKRVRAEGAARSRRKRPRAS